MNALVEQNTFFSLDDEPPCRDPVQISAAESSSWTSSTLLMDTLFQTSAENHLADVQNLYVQTLLDLIYSRLLFACTERLGLFAFASRLACFCSSAR